SGSWHSAGATHVRRGARGWGTRAVGAADRASHAVRRGGATGRAGALLGEAPEESARAHDGSVLGAKDAVRSTHRERNALLCHTPAPEDAVGVVVAPIAARGRAARVGIA